MAAFPPTRLRPFCANPVVAANPLLAVQAFADAESVFGTGVHATLVVAGATLLAGAALSLATGPPAPAAETA